MAKKKEHVVVVGSGISGIVAAYLLDKKYKVTLVEKSDRLGGHTHTVKVKEDVNASVSVDTGFIVFNLKNYPLFTKFLSVLNVPFKDSDMSFGYYNAAKNFWYSSDFPFGVFSIKKHLFSIKFWKFLFQINKFNKRVLTDLSLGCIKGQSLSDYLDSLPFNSLLYESYVLPMGAAIWSCPTKEILGFPAKSFFSFWQNHSLLTLGERPVWKTVKNGSCSYIDAFLKKFSGTVKVGSGVKSIKRVRGICKLILRDGETMIADKVVIATHADQALALLEEPTQAEVSVLGSWRYSKNIVYLHTDPSVMPPNRNAWASWLVQEQGALGSSLNMSYYMNRLQSLNTNKDYFVTLNNKRLISPEKLIQTIPYTHPIFDSKSIASQSSLPLLNTGPVYFCGSYFGYGFHEDGVKSAVNICNSLGLTIE